MLSEFFHAHGAEYYGLLKLLCWYRSLRRCHHDRQFRYAREIAALRNLLVRP